MKINIKFNIKAKLVEYLRAIHDLDEALFNRSLMIGLAAFALLVLGSVYYVYNSCRLIEKEIAQLQGSKRKTYNLLLDYASIDGEETRVRKVLDEHKNFNLKIYFEQFCKENGFSAVPNWDTTTTAENAQVDEIALTATFKELTMENLVRMLLAFDKTEIIYIKNLRIKSEKERKITCDVTLATVRTKIG